ncbi:putative Ubiquitin carboxyl-terminal hydrolase 14 [Hypsibius exemplaris]|uniref:Ubiquitin carboxyl-terminal hydrolase 14 n=1 Tax=Hypsibius exemplaris TaxID=2072580 RepID=A0A9X6NJ74_HYPEX|nr:putative Ubiquitin carboxyl-terminal hydrolase 14 [Hypsibius exemplaris]
MPPVRVNVKWGKQKFDDVEVNTEDTPEIFKAQLYALSGVPPDRQKLMVKGKTIQDQAWGDVKLTDGAGVMMMWQYRGIPTKPQSATKGADDDDDPMDDDEKMPVGLVNLGNTCYLNASLQCFRAVPELRQSLKQNQVSSSWSSSRFKEVVSANAVTLGRNADFDKVMKISRLPAYLTVQMVRFLLQRTPSCRCQSAEGREVPLLLDVFDLCSPVLQKKLQPYREKFRERDESAVQRDIAATRLAKQTNVTVNAPGVTALGSSHWRREMPALLRLTSMRI